MVIADLNSVCRQVRARQWLRVEQRASPAEPMAANLARTWTVAWGAVAEAVGRWLDDKKVAGGSVRQRSRQNKVKVDGGATETAYRNFCQESALCGKESRKTRLAWSEMRLEVSGGSEKMRLFSSALVQRLIKDGSRCTAFSTSSLSLPLFSLAASSASPSSRPGPRPASSSFSSCFLQLLLLLTDIPSNFLTLTQNIFSFRPGRRCWCSRGLRFAARGCGSGGGWDGLLRCTCPASPRPAAPSPDCAWAA